MHYPSFLVLVVFVSACAGAAKRAPVLELEPGLEACKVTVTRDGHTGAIARTRDGLVVREAEDLDGDGRPEVLRDHVHDRAGRLQSIEVRSSDGAAVVERALYRYAGDRLERIERDRFLADGSTGVDGVADEVHAYRWEGSRLVGEEIDQVGADGLLGVDGTPDLVTTWVWEGEERRTGTRVDPRDGAVLQVEQLTWQDGQLLRTEVDLGGDGQVDVTVAHTYQDGRLIRVDVDGRVERAVLRYEYCR